MKLAKVETGHSFFQKLKLGLMRLQLGERAPDVVRVLMYRPKMFGKAFNKYTQRLLRGPSEWTVGERELIAAHVSQANDCHFCYVSHRAVAARALSTNVVDAIFDGKADAPISPQLRATLDFVQKLTRKPAEVTAADADVVRAAGVSQESLETAIHICAAFCVINRLANSLGFAIPSLKGFDRAARFLLRFGYDT